MMTHQTFTQAAPETFTMYVVPPATHDTPDAHLSAVARAACIIGQAVNATRQDRGRGTRKTSRADA